MPPKQMGSPMTIRNPNDENNMNTLKVSMNTGFSHFKRKAKVVDEIKV
jgi:hypothetical protein